MEAAGGSGDPKNINRKVIINANKLFDILHDDTPAKDKLPLMTEVLSCDNININLPDMYNRGNTLLHGAVLCCFVYVVKLLLQYKADVNLKNAEGETPLHLVLSDKIINKKKVQTSIIQILLGHKADVNIQNLAGDTLLHLAVRQENIPVIRLLVGKADVRIQNSAGKTPLDLAKEKNNSKINDIFDSNKINKSNDKIDSDDIIDLKDIFDISFNKPDPVPQDEITRDQDVISPDQDETTPDLDYNAGFAVATLARDENHVEVAEDNFANFPRKYKVSGAKLSMHGTVYQVYLLNMFALRALNLEHEFILGTEVKEAEQFDDIVLYQFSESGKKIKALFVQVKHRANAGKGLNSNDLLAKSKKAEFSVLKYFKSFVKINQAKGDKSSEIDFAICTNVPFNFQNGETGKLSGGEITLSLKLVTDAYPGFFTEGKCYKLDMDDKQTVEDLRKYLIAAYKEESCLKEDISLLEVETKTDFLENTPEGLKTEGKEETIKPTEKESPLKDVISLIQVETKTDDVENIQEVLTPEGREKTNIYELVLSSLKDGKSLATFLTNLIFVVEQPADIKSVQPDFKVHAESQQLDTDLLADAFYKQIFDWFSKGDGVHLQKENIKNMIGSIRGSVNTFASSWITRVYAEKLLTSPIKFNKKKLDELNEVMTKYRIVNIATSMDLKLTLILVAQAIEYYCSNEARSIEPSGSNETHTAKPSGSNEAQYVKASDSNEAQHIESSGTNKTQTTEPSGSNEAQGIEPSGSNKEQAIEYSGSNEAQSIESSGSNEAQTTKPSGSNEAQGIEPSCFNKAQAIEYSGSNEAQSIESSGSYEAQTTKPSGSNEAQGIEPSCFNESQAIEYSGSNEAQCIESSGSNEAQTTEPSGSNELHGIEPTIYIEAQTIEYSGSNEAQPKESSGSNEAQTTQPSGSNEAQGIEPSGSNDAQAIEYSGSNEAQSIEFSGSNEAKTTEPSGSNEAHGIEPSGSIEAHAFEPYGSNEAQSIEPSGSNEAQYIEPSGSNEAQTTKSFGSNEALDSCMFMRLSSLLNTQEVVVETFKSSVKNNLLVIDCLSKKTDFKKDAVKKLFKKLSVITTNNPRKKLVIITAENHDKLDGMFNKCSGYFKHKVTNTWKDLTNETQDMMLQKEVDFQGNVVELNQVIDKNETELLEIVPLETLMGDEGLVIGTELPTPIGYNESLYIDRSVNTVNQIVFKADIIKDKSEEKFKVASTEAEFQNLYIKHPKANIHLIEKKGGKYIWVKSRGDFNALRPYIDNIDNKSCSEEEFLNSVKQQRVVIISDLAGMGKSTVLTHISEQIKSNTEGTLVFRIDLNNYTKLWQKHESTTFDNSSALDCLCNEIIMIKTPLESALFKREGKVVLLFDGFDEISPDYEKTVLGLIQNLIEATEAQIWITTRPFMKENLEDKLCQLSSSLVPLSKKDQVDYLTKYWKYMKNIKDSEDEKKIKEFAKSIISQFSKSISDKEREFTGIPLLMKMLAECFIDNFENPIDLTERFNLVDLYKNFIDRKFELYFSEKNEIDGSKVLSKQMKDLLKASCHTQHNNLALLVIISEKKFDLLIPDDKEVIDSDKKIMINKIGIVNLSNDTPHFIHRTFAEYWVAEYFMELLKYPTCLSPDMTEFILSELLISDNYEILRSFLNGLLATCKLSEIKNPLLTNEDINKNFEIIQNNFVRTAIEGNNNIFEYLLNGVEGKDKLMLKLLQGNPPDESLLYLAADNNNSQYIESLLQYTLDNTDHGQERVKQMLEAHGRFGWTPLIFASTRGHCDVVQTLLKWTRENLTEDQEIVKQMLEARDKHERTSLSIASWRGHNDVVQTLLKWTRENLTEDQGLVKRMLEAVDNEGRTPLHRAAQGGNNTVVHTLLKWTRDNLSEAQDVVKQMLEARDYEGRTPLHCAALLGNNAVVQTLLKWTRDNLSEVQDVVKQMLKAVDKYGWTSLHIAALLGKNAVVQTLLQFTLDCLGEETLRELLLLRDSEDMTALSYQYMRFNPTARDKIMQWAEGDNNINIQEYITELYKSDLKPDESDLESDESDLESDESDV